MIAADLPKHPFFFLRHGETDWNRDGRIAGHTDIPLNAEGRAQAEAAAKKLAVERISRVVHSPLLRARDTAAIIAAGIGAPMTVVPGLAECQWGAMEGRIPTAGDFGWIDAWQRGEGPAGAETFFEFRSRVLAALADAIVPGEAGAGRTILVSHGGVYRVLREAMGHSPGFGGGDAEPVLCEPPFKARQPWRIVPLGGGV
ncbi:MAG: histidine phosphatase family protein [Alphaproteobacteria bacterium]|nr:histidine phosphatase family protein [Alphaproteobacteria bacterium]